MSSWRVRRLTEPDEISTFLRQDRWYAAYALGDLEPGFFEQCQWFGADTMGELCSLVLLYEGLDPQALFLMGEPTGITLILGAARPTSAMFICTEWHLPALRAYYQTGEVDAMLRMTLAASDFRPADSPDVERLGPGYADELAHLYTCAHGNAFSPYQLAQGVFYGIKEDGRLVSAAGTHLVARTTKIAAVGNVCTYPEQRGRGYATFCTSAVCSELLGMGLDVVLNVERDNASAIHVYQKLGFRMYCPFVEGIAVRKGVAESRQ
jgi:ribosomal protein S18 acetylase RimI-like enzyme